MYLSIQDICIRLGMAIIFSGVIGINRESKSRPAGMRTHILLCVGAALIAMTQQKISFNTINQAIENPDLASVLRADPSRLTAQIISGIGFLGAGTIIITKRSIQGLTTAASLWSVAALGISIGMGFYPLSALSFIAIFLVLTVPHKLIHLPELKCLEIRYSSPTETRRFLTEYFNEKGVEIKNVVFDVDFSREEHTYTNIYTIYMPKNQDHTLIIEDLSKCKYISRIRSIAM